MGDEPWPTMNAPPWMNTITGSLLPAVAPGGVHTFRNRQSSDCAVDIVSVTVTLDDVVVVSGPKDCGQISPKLVARMVVSDAASASVGFHRSWLAPVGACAYGMPRYTGTTTCA